MVRVKSETVKQPNCPPVDQAPPAAAGETIPPMPDDFKCPADRWSRVVRRVRELAPLAAYFWPVWCAVYRYLRRCEGGATGATFYRLFDVYRASGGRGSTFDRADSCGGPAK